MLRDTRADEEYFRTVSARLREMSRTDDKRLTRPIDEWRKPHALGVAAADAVDPRWNLFGSLYSLGAPREELRAAFDDVLAAAERARRMDLETIPDDLAAKRFAFGKNRDFTRERLWLVSLALAFGVDDATFDRVVFAVERGHGERLLDRLIATRRPEHPIGEDLPFPRILGSLDAAFDAADPERAVASVRKYLDGWYPAWKGTMGWGGHEAQHVNHYWGYWAFEVPGVVTALGLDDASLRDNEFYPRDLLG